MELPCVLSSAKLFKFVALSFLPKALFSRKETSLLFPRLFVSFRVLKSVLLQRNDYDSVLLFQYLLALSVEQIILLAFQQSFRVA